MSTSAITFDTSDLDNLNDMLTRAAAKVDTTRARGLEHTARSVRDQAAATARSYPHATGELADSVEIRGTPLTKVVGSTKRQGFFLEFGSPTTGGPRPWLTQPARLGMTALLEELGKAAIPE